MVNPRLYLKLKRVNMDQKDRTHKIADLSHDNLLRFAEEIACRRTDNGVTDYRVLLCSDDYKVELISFPKGKVIKPHLHSKSNTLKVRPLFKILLTGKITYQDGQEELLPMQIACVEEEILYNGEVKEDSLLMLITPTNSKVSISS